MEAANKTSTLASCLQVFRLSFRRQFFTRQTIVMVLLLGLAVLITFLGTWRETLNTPRQNLLPKSSPHSTWVFCFRLSA